MKPKELEKLEPWHRELQEAAHKTFWILEFHYPWNTCYTPKNMRGAMLLHADGSSQVRFRVLDNGRAFQVLQYRFRSASTGKLTRISTIGRVLRIYQNTLGIEWNAIMTHAQLLAFVNILTGKINTRSL